MIVLDTNVISELMRDAPRASVLAWLNDQPSASLFVTTITEAEVHLGIALLPTGKRRDGIAEAAGRAFGIFFHDRILPFDSEAAHAYAVIAAKRRADGHPISQFDCQIASIARCRGAALATRNPRDFEGSGIDLIDPWGQLADQ
jgi:toxin FitB